MSAATITAVRLVLAPDEDPDLSYLDDDEHAEADAAQGAAARRAAYGDSWEMVSIQARATVRVDAGTYGISTDVASPGLYGIESDSGPDYFDVIGTEELSTLGTMLTAFGFTPDAIAAAFADVAKDWS